MTRIVPRLPFGYPTDPSTGQPNRNASLAQRIAHGGLRSPLALKNSMASPPRQPLPPTTDEMSAPKDTIGEGTHLVDSSATSSWTGPVRVLSGDEAEELAARLQTRLAKDWKPDLSLGHDAPYDVQQWNDKLHQAQLVLKSMDKKSEMMLGCIFDKQPIGLAALRTPDIDAANADKGLELVDIMTHPGATGAGGALIERAADLSQARGFEGKLQLVAMGSAARAAYLALGFVDDGELMTLTPSSPENADRWSRKDGEWRLKKYLTKDLAAGMNDLARGSARPSPP